MFGPKRRRYKADLAGSDQAVIGGRSPNASRSLLRSALVPASRSRVEAGRIVQPNLAQSALGLVLALPRPSGGRRPPMRNWRATFMRPRSSSRRRRLPSRARARDLMTFMNAGRPDGRTQDIMVGIWVPSSILSSPGMASVAVPRPSGGRRGPKGNFRAPFMPPR
jgi:hypothetical protein